MDIVTFPKQREIQSGWDAKRLKYNCRAELLLLLFWFTNNCQFHMISIPILAWKLLGTPAFYVNYLLVEYNFSILIMWEPFIPHTKVKSYHGNSARFLALVGVTPELFVFWTPTTMPYFVSCLPPHEKEVERPSQLWTSQHCLGAHSPTCRSSSDLVESPQVLLKRTGLL